MDELAAALGISKRTIYENYKDKEDILLSVLTHLKEQRDATFKEFLSKCENVVEVFIKIIEIQQSTPYASPKFYEDIYKYYPQISKLIQEDIERKNVYSRSFLQEGIKQGYIRKDLNVEVAAFLVEESSYTYLRASYLEKPPFSFPELLYTMMINFVRGISTEKGIKIIDDYLEKQKKE